YEFANHSGVIEGAMDGVRSADGLTGDRAIAADPETPPGASETLRSVHAAQLHLLRSIPNARAVPGAPVAAIRAFLDGTQRSEVAGWCGALPLVYGSAGAVVRERIHRRLTTWERPLVQHRIYAPLAYAPRAELEEALGAMLEDTTKPSADGTIV